MATRAEADALDETLEIAENLGRVISAIVPSISEQDAETLSIHLAEHRKSLIAGFKKDPAAILDMLKPADQSGEAPPSNVTPIANAG